MSNHEDWFAWPAEASRRCSYADDTAGNIISQAGFMGTIVEAQPRPKAVGCSDQLGVTVLLDQSILCDLYSRDGLGKCFCNILGDQYGDRKELAVFYCALLEYGNASNKYLIRQSEDMA